jgi:hypothetical protein
MTLMALIREDFDARRLVAAISAFGGRTLRDVTDRRSSGNHP